MEEFILTSEQEDEAERIFENAMARARGPDPKQSHWFHKFH